MPKRTELEKTFKACIAHCILLSIKEKKEWLAKTNSLPDVLLEKTIAALEEKNRITDTYIKAALKDDKNQEHLKGIKKKVKEIYRKTAEMDKKISQEQAETLLSQQIKNL